MMLVLAVTSCLLELMIAAKVPIWRQLSGRYPLFNLLNSLFLSFVMGIAFGAAGLVAMGAGVISTVLSVPGYKFLYWNYDTPEAKLHGGNQFKYYRANFKVHFSKWQVALSDLTKLTYNFIKFITFPIWFTRAVFVKVNPYIKNFNTWLDKRRRRKAILKAVSSTR
jgi:hypothetical protein